MSTRLPRRKKAVNIGSQQSRGIELVSYALRGFGLEIDYNEEFKAGFLLARKIQGALMAGGFNPQLFNPGNFTQIVQKAALNSSLNMDADELVIAVEVAWDKVKVPEGQSYVTYALALAKQSNWRPRLRTAFPTTESRQEAEMIVATIYVLQTLYGPKDVYLPCRTAAELLGITVRKAANLINMLIKGGDLREIQPATTSRARRLNYILPQTESETE